MYVCMYVCIYNMVLHVLYQIGRRQNVDHHVVRAVSEGDAHSGAIRLQCSHHPRNLPVRQQ